ncbi:MAG: Asp-tRNA(Asn)/Glu-tRNA(Gln) amidotransferase subunit GatC [Gammaproteobacteria bacterium]|nr:Asp-tRNA(Asn)/Glu-tRNA(Gln) amidotransferase subunit GatC [Gammaproteobacteria bacterium]
MSSINIDHLCALAALKLTAAERELVQGDLANIINMIDSMQAVTTDGVVPMANPLDMQQRLRADKIIEQVDRAALQQITTHTHDGYYVVPRFVE